MKNIYPMMNRQRDLWKPRKMSTDLFLFHSELLNKVNIHYIFIYNFFYIILLLYIGKETNKHAVSVLSPCKWSWVEKYRVNEVRREKEYEEFKLKL